MHSIFPPDESGGNSIWRQFNLEAIQSGGIEWKDLKALAKMLLIPFFKIYNPLAKA